MDDLGCAVNHVLSCLCWGRTKKVNYSVRNLLFFSVFAFMFQILINLTFVKLAFPLFQGQIAACKTCIKLASPGKACFTEFFGAFFGVQIALFFLSRVAVFTLLLRNYCFVINKYV